jgi:hypothetical protein
MVDTLKLVKRLQRANLSAEQAEAIAEALAQADYITKPELRFDVRSGLAKLKSQLVRCIVGSVAVGVLLNHFWK